MNEYKESEYAFYRATIWTAQRQAVDTPHGFVLLYEQDNYMEMDFIHNHRWYRRIWKRTFADRTLITLAKRFAAEKAGTE